MYAKCTRCGSVVEVCDCPADETSLLAELSRYRQRLAEREKEIEYLKGDGHVCGHCGKICFCDKDPEVDPIPKNYCHCDPDLKKFADKIQSLQAENAELKFKLDKQDGDCAVGCSAVEDLTAKVDNLNSVHLELIGKHEAMKQEKADLEEKIEGLEKENQSLMESMRRRRLNNKTRLSAALEIIAELHTFVCMVDKEIFLKFPSVSESNSFVSSAFAAVRAANCRIHSMASAKDNLPCRPDCKLAALLKSKLNKKVESRLSAALEILESAKVLLARSCIQTDEWLTKDIDNWAGSYEKFLSATPPTAKEG